MEMIYNFRKNFPFLFLKTSILLSFFFLFYTFVSFSRNISLAPTTITDISENKNLYTITDTLFDSGEFRRFRDSKESLQTLQAFYERLNTNSNFQFVSAFHQPLFFESFKGDEIFYFSPPFEDEETGRMYYPIRSMQMNRNFFERYQLNVSQGEVFAWENVDFESGTLPIILGANYKGIFQINDRIKGQFYFRDYEFQVIGFLENNSFVFYQGDINHDLDSSMILPYPEMTISITEENKEFVGILYFAMLGGDIFIDARYDFSFLNQELAQIARDTGFFDYTLLGVASFALQYQQMFESINANQQLLYVFFTIILVISLFLVAFLNEKSYKRRNLRYFIGYLHGDSMEKISGLVIRNSLSENMLIPLLFLFIVSFIPNQSEFALSTTFIGIAIFLLFDILWVIGRIRKDIRNNFIHQGGKYF